MRLRNYLCVSVCDRRLEGKKDRKKERQDDWKKAKEEEKVRKRENNKELEIEIKENLYTQKLQMVAKYLYSQKYSQVSGQAEPFL